MSHHQASLSDKIIRNTVFNILGKSWGTLVSLALTPYIIHRIGLERFGIWAIAGMISGYFGLMDFSFGASFVKYISEHYAKKEFVKISEVVNTGTIFYFLLCAGTVGIFFLIIMPLVDFLRIPAGLRQESIFVFLLAVIIFSLVNIFSAFTAVSDGLQRMDVTNKIAIAVSVPNIAGTIFVIEKGYGLSGLMWNNLLVCLLGGLMAIFMSKRLLPQLGFGPRYLSAGMFKKLLGFGFQVQVTRLAMIINNSVVKILTSHFLNIVIVGFYELGQKAVMFGRDASLLTVSGVLPAASEIHANNDSVRIHELYIRGSKYLHGLVLPALALIYATAPLIIISWINSEYADSILTIQTLAPAHMVNMLTAVGVLMCYGVGKPAIAAKSMVITAVLNVLLNTFLILKMGFLGALIGTSVALVLGSLFFIYNFNRYLKVSGKLFFEMTVLKPFAASLCAALPVLSVVWYYRLCHIPVHRLTGLLLLSANAALFISIYIAVILKTDFLDTVDWHHILKALNYFKIRKER